MSALPLAVRGRANAFMMEAARPSQEVLEPELLPRKRGRSPAAKPSKRPKPVDESTLRRSARLRKPVQRDPSFDWHGRDLLESVGPAPVLQQDTRVQREAVRIQNDMQEPPSRQRVVDGMRAEIDALHQSDECADEFVHQMRWFHTAMQYGELVLSVTRVPFSETDQSRCCFSVDLHARMNYAHEHVRAHGCENMDVKGASYPICVSMRMIVGLYVGEIWMSVHPSARQPRAWAMVTHAYAYDQYGHDCMSRAQSPATCVFMHVLYRTLMNRIMHNVLSATLLIMPRANRFQHLNDRLQWTSIPPEVVREFQVRHSAALPVAAHGARFIGDHCATGRLAQEYAELDNAHAVEYYQQILARAKRLSCNTGEPCRLQGQERAHQFCSMLVRALLKGAMLQVPHPDLFAYDQTQKLVCVREPVHSGLVPEDDDW